MSHNVTIPGSFSLPPLHLWKGKLIKGETFVSLHLRLLKCLVTTPGPPDPGNIQQYKSRCRQTQSKYQYIRRFTILCQPFIFILSGYNSPKITKPPHDFKIDLQRSVKIRDKQLIHHDDYWDNSYLFRTFIIYLILTFNIQILWALIVCCVDDIVTKPRCANLLRHTQTDKQLESSGAAESRGNTLTHRHVEWQLTWSSDIRKLHIQHFTLHK